MKKIKLIGFIALLALIALFVHAYSNSHVDAVKELYGYEQWVGITKTNYLHTITSFIPDFTGSGYSTNYPPSISEVEEVGLYYSYSLKENILFNEDINAKIHIRNNVVLIHDLLMEMFAYSSAWQPFPRGETISISLGDRCYLGYPTNSPASITFVRNNVYICVSANDSTNSVLPIATWLDNKILEMSFD